MSPIHLSMTLRNLPSVIGIRNKHKWGFIRGRDNIPLHWRDTTELDLQGWAGFKCVEKHSREREQSEQRLLSGKGSRPYEYQQGVNCLAISITTHQAVTQ